MPNFEYSTRELQTPSGTPALVVELSGSVDPGTFDDFSAMFDTLLEGEVHNIIIDFSGLKYINSTGMGLMVQIADSFAEKGGKFVLVNIPSKVMLVMEMLGLQEFFQIVSTVDAALEVFEGGEGESASVQMHIKGEEKAKAEEKEKAAPAVKKPAAAIKKPAIKKAAAPEPEAVEKGGVACGHCGARLTVGGAGKYRCPRCRSLLAVDESGQAETHAEAGASVLELGLPANVEYVEALRLLLSTAGAQAGVNGDDLSALTSAVEDCSRYLIDKALGADAPQRLQLLVEGGSGALTVRIYAAGQSLELENQDLSGVEGLDAAVQAVDRLEFNAPQGGNLFVLEKRAG
jgi:anti-anti-sigma factor